MVKKTKLEFKDLEEIAFESGEESTGPTTELSQELENGASNKKLLLQNELSPIRQVTDESKPEQE